MGLSSISRYEGLSFRKTFFEKSRSIAQRLLKTSDPCSVGDPLQTKKLPRITDGSF